MNLKLPTSIWNQMQAGIFNYSTTVFIDTMVILEGPPLSQQPWHEIDEKGPILVVVVPQVQREVDKRKRDGRLAERARAFTRLIGPAAETQAAIPISTQRVVVDLMMASCGSVDWKALDLDPDEADHRVIGQILSTRNVDPNGSVLISHDINPIAIAAQHGLRTFRLPDHWLLPQEPSAKDKENAKLKAELQALRKAEPQLAVNIAVDAGPNFAVQSVKPVSDTEQISLIDAIVARHARQTPGKAALKLFSIPGMDDGPSDSDVEKFESQAVPNYVNDLAANIELLYNQIPFSVHVQNTGSVSARGLVVEIRVLGSTFNDRFYFPDVYPPKPPRGKSMLSPLIPFAPLRINTPGPYDLVLGISPDRSGYGELHCEDFRHGRIAAFEGFLTIDPRLEISVRQIEVRVTCNNMHGDVTTSAILRFPVVSRHFTELVDSQELKLLLDYPCKEAIHRALQDGETDWVEFANED